MKNKECFAYKPGKCYVTTYDNCRECKFFKTLDEYIDGLNKYPPHTADAVQQIETVLALRERYTGEHAEWTPPEFPYGTGGKLK